MRKFAAYSLVIAFGLFHMGYYITYLSLKQERNQYWETRMVNGDLGEVTIFQRSFPISLPYQPDHEDLLNSKFESGGKVFRVLKHRYEKDTLHILYVNDVKEEKLGRSLDEWAGALTHKTPTEKNSSKPLIALEKNYLSCLEDFQFKKYPTGENKNQFSYRASEIKSYIEVPELPPWAQLS